MLMLPCLLGGEPSPTSLQRHTNHLQLCLLGGKPTLMLLCLLGGEPSPTSLHRHTNHLQLCLLGGKTTLMLLCLLGGEPSPTSLHLPLENPKKQRHFVTADLSEATSKQCCPRNSAILLRSFLSKCAQKTAPFCYGRFAGSNLTSNAVRETAPFCYDRFFPGHVPKKQRHFVTADLWEATSQAMLLCS